MESARRTLEIINEALAGRTLMEVISEVALEDSRNAPPREYKGPLREAFQGRRIIDITEENTGELMRSEFRGRTILDVVVENTGNLMKGAFPASTQTKKIVFTLDDAGKIEIMNDDRKIVLMLNGGGGIEIARDNFKIVFALDDGNEVKVAYGNCQYDDCETAVGQLLHVVKGGFAIWNEFEL